MQTRFLPGFLLKIISLTLCSKIIAVTANSKSSASISQKKLMKYYIVTLSLGDLSTMFYGLGVWRHFVSITIIALMWTKLKCSLWATVQCYLFNWKSAWISQFCIDQFFWNASKSANISQKFENIFDLFLWIWFNCLNVAELLSASSLFWTTKSSKKLWYSCGKPYNDEKVSQAWRHLVGLNLGPLEWETTCPFVSLWYVEALDVKRCCRN